MGRSVHSSREDQGYTSRTWRSRGCSPRGGRSTADRPCISSRRTRSTPSSKIPVDMSISPRLLRRPADLHEVDPPPLPGGLLLSQKNLDISPGQVVWPRMVMIVGPSMIFAPLNLSAHPGHAQGLHGTAVGLSSLLRNGGECGHFAGPDVSRATRPIPQLASGGVPQPLHPGRALLLRGGSGVVPQPDGRSGDVVAEGSARSREPTPAAGLVAVESRLFLAVRRLGARAHALGVPHEALGGREGCSRRRSNGEAVLQRPKAAPPDIPGCRVRTPGKHKERAHQALETNARK